MGVLLSVSLEAVEEWDQETSKPLGLPQLRPGLIGGHGEDAQRDRRIRVERQLDFCLPDPGKIGLRPSDARDCLTSMSVGLLIRRSVRSRLAANDTRGSLSVFRPDAAFKAAWAYLPTAG